ncbi:unnamed protein product [Rhizoctonia solani]|uniref:Uncharacterized protein n=1 Tax=Rhizoctonia solani TaxID=456999 RepID=A0A8H3A256_9AGAM|nr:unnamed protein product [Rhizoctonia solani]
MFSHTPGFDPGRVGLGAHQLDVDYDSTNLQVSRPYVNYVSDSNYGSDSNEGHVATLSHPTKSFSATDRSARLRAPEGSSLFGSYSSPYGPTPETIDIGTTLQGPLPDSPSTSTQAPTNTASVSIPAVDRDNITVERILSGTSPVRQDVLLSRFFHDLALPIESSRRRATWVQPNVASRRVFSFPTPVFDIAPTIELPPSRDTSRISATSLREELNEEFDGELGEDQLISYSVSSSLPMAEAELNHPCLPRILPVTLASPRNAYYSCSVARGVPSLVSSTFGRRPSARPPSSVDISPAFTLAASATNDLPYRTLSPGTSTPVWHFSEASSFTDDNPSVNPTNTTQYHPSISRPSVPRMSQYYIYPEQPGAHHPRAYPPGHESWRFERTGSIKNQTLADGSLSPGYSLHFHRANFGPAPNFTTSHNQSYSPVTFDDDSYDGRSEIELVGNCSEDSMFGPPIYPGPFQSPSSSTNAALRIHTRPFVNVQIPRGARTGILSPTLRLTENDAWVNEPSPPTPSPDSRVSYVRPSLSSVLGAYDSPVLARPENTLPPLGYPEDPYQIVLPSISHILGEVDEDEQDLSQVKSLVDGHEGDNEDESDNEDEYDQYFSSDEDGSVDLEHVEHNHAGWSPGYQSPSFTGSYAPVEFSESNGSAHYKGYVAHSTDDKW